MLSIAKVLVTQCGLRDPDQVQEMIAHVRSGGLFDKHSIEAFCTKQDIQHSGVINISIFEDGQMYFHDGHHRVFAIWQAGRQELYDCEYVIRRFSYDDYTSPNITKGFVTPFDPRTEVRLPDFRPFKDEMIKMWHGLLQSGSNPENVNQAVSEQIEKRKHEYKTVRTFSQVFSLNLASETISKRRDQSCLVRHPAAQNRRVQLADGD